MMDTSDNTTLPKASSNTLNRRGFLLSALALGLSPTLRASPQNAQNQRQYWVSAQGRKSEKYSLSWVDEETHQVDIALSGFRGHGMSQHPLYPASLLMYSRRPGNTVIQVNLKTGRLENQFKCAENRHLFGHGCFSQDGKTLFTTEADPLTGEGKIGIRDAQTYAVIGEYESHGIGPHELKLMPDGKTLVIANGGILTHPDSGRKKLNLDTMKSSLIYIDVANGEKLAAFEVDEPKASIRHLDVATDGTVAFAMQVQRVATSHQNTVPLGGIHKLGQAKSCSRTPKHWCTK